MFTPEGLSWVAALVGRNLDHAVLRVTDGDKASADAAIAEVVNEKQAVVLRGRFGEGEANFDWKTIGVVLSGGLEVDQADKDQGRKVAGSVWTVEHRIDLAAE